MTAINGADFSSLITQIGNLAGSAGAGTGSGSVGFGFNDIWTAQQQLTQLKEGDEQQRINALQGLVNKIISIANNRAAAAEKKAKEAETKSQQVQQKQQQATSQNDAAVQEASAAVQANTEEVEAVQEKADEVMQQQEELQEQQKRVKEQIEAKEQELREFEANTNPTPEEEARALNVLNELGGLRDNLAALGEQITALDKTQEGVQQEKAQAEQNLEKTIEQKAKTEEEGQQRIQAVVTDANSLVTQKQQAEAQALQDKAAAVQFGIMAAAAEKAEAVPVAGALAGASSVELRRKEADANAAATTGTQSAAATQGAVIATAQGLQPSVNLIQTFSNGAVGDININQNLVGEIGTKLSPYVPGQGSALQETADSLGKAIESDKAQVQKEKEENDKNKDNNGNGEKSAPLQSTQVDTKKLEQNGDAA